MEEARGMDLHRQFLSLPPVELSVLFFHLKQETNKEMPLSNNNNNNKKIIIIKKKDADKEYIQLFVC